MTSRLDISREGLDQAARCLGIRNSVRVFVCAYPLGKGGYIRLGGR